MSVFATQIDIISVRPSKLSWYGDTKKKLSGYFILFFHMAVGKWIPNVSRGSWCSKQTFALLRYCWKIINFILRAIYFSSTSCLGVWLAILGISLFTLLEDFGFCTDKWKTVDTTSNGRWKNTLYSSRIISWSVDYEIYWVHNITYSDDKMWT